MRMRTARGKRLSSILTLFSEMILCGRRPQSAKSRHGVTLPDPELSGHYDGEGGAMGLH